MLVPAQRSRTAQLALTSQPAGARVRFDGREAGTTPLTIDDIAPGRHRLSLDLPGYESHEEWILFSAGDRLSRHVDLSVVTGTLEIAVPDDIDSAEILVSVGSIEYAGPTLDLPVGTYAVVVRAFGYSPYRRNVTIAAQSSTTLYVPLEPTHLEIYESGLRSSAISPRNPPPFDRMQLRFRVNTPSRYRVSVVDAAGTEIYREDGSITSPDPLEIIWLPPSVAAESSYRVLLTVRDDRSSVSDVYSLRVSPFSLIGPRLLSIYGRGTSLVRIPSRGFGVPAISFGSGYGVDERNDRSQLPVTGAISFFPFSRWETTVSSRAFADTSGSDWSGLAALTVSTPPLVNTTGPSVRITTTIDLNGVVGTRDTSPWRRNSFLLSAPTAINSRMGGVGIAIQPGVSIDLDVPDQPEAGIVAGGTIYVQNSRLFAGASGRFAYDYAGDTLFIYGIDTATRISRLPAFLTVGALFFYEERRVATQASIVIFR